MRRLFWAAAVLGAGIMMSSAASAAETTCRRDDAQCKSLLAKAKRIRARDPAAEARAEIAQGNFKLGQATSYGQPLAVALAGSSSNLPGVICLAWPSSLVGKQLGTDDTIFPGEGEHQQAATAFLTIYNRTKVQAPEFPYPDICAIEGEKPAKTYDRPVTTVAQAARSGDPTKLEALNPSREAVNAPDEFFVTPLGWAMLRKNLPMGLALIERGADPNIIGWAEATTPLGLAILNEDYATARALRKKGARLYEGTGLCPKVERRMLYWADELRAAQSSPDPDAIPEAGNCSWAGLLLQKGQIDLLAELLETAPPFIQDQDDEAGLRNEMLGLGDVADAFKRAVLTGDVVLANRLAPYVNDDTDYPGALLGWLYRHKAYDFLLAKVVRHADAVHSPVEAGLWNTAATHKQPQAFALLWDYGHALNHLTPDQVKACDAAVAAGDQAAMAEICIRLSFRRAEAVYAAIKAKDTARLKTLLAESASLAEDYKPQLETYIARDGVAGMLDLLPPRPKKGDFYFGHLTMSAAIDGKRNLMDRRMYDGALKADLDAFVLPYVSFPVEDDMAPISIAVAKGDVTMVRGLVARGYDRLSQQVISGTPLARGFEDNVRGVDAYSRGFINSEPFPVRPDAATWQRLSLFVPVIAEAEGPDGLIDIFRYAVGYGWNDVIDLAVASGFDAKTTKAPVDTWKRWAGHGFSSLCKPSTGRKLLGLGLPMGPLRAEEWTVLYTAAISCRDLASIRMLVTEAGLNVNEVKNTETALDAAENYHRPQMAALLKSLGGKTGEDLVPDQIAERLRKDIAEGADPDFWQGD